MPEVNEEVIKQYLEAKGFFVKTDVKYLRPMAKTKLKSSGWSDLDIVATSNEGTNYLIQVKGWHTESFSPSYFKGGPWFDELARKKADEVLGGRKFKTIMVIPRFGKRSEAAVRKLAKDEGIDDVWTFGEVIQTLLDHVEENVNYDSEVLQTIRLLKVYGFLKKSP